MWELDKVEKTFETNLEKGLTTQAAGDKLEKFGQNKLTEKGKTPKWVIFLKE